MLFATRLGVSSSPSRAGSSPTIASWRRTRSASSALNGNVASSSESLGRGRGSLLRAKVLPEERDGLRPGVLGCGEVVGALLGDDVVRLVLARRARIVLRPQEAVDGALVVRAGVVLPVC